MTLTNDAASMVPGVVIRVMTVDDHPILRDGLAALLAFYVTERIDPERVLVQDTPEFHAIQARVRAWPAPPKADSAVAASR